MFLRQLCEMASRFANPKFLRRLKSTLQRCFEGAFCHCLENHLEKMSKNCLCKMSYIILYEMTFRQLWKVSFRFANPTSFRRLKDILPKCFDCLHKTALRHLWDVFLPTGVIMCYNKLQCVARVYRNNAAKGLVWKFLKSSFFLKEVIRYYNVLQLRYKKLQKIGICVSYNVTQEIFFSRGRGKAATTRYNKLQCITRGYKNNEAQGLVLQLIKSSFFIKEGISYYNVLQQVKMCYKSLQKQRSPRTSLKVAQKFFFFLKEVRSCYNVIQWVKMHYKRLQKIGMCTTFNVA